MAEKSFITRRKTLISMLFIGVTLLGIISYRLLPVELFPDVELPFLIVQVSTFQQTDPQTLEKEAVIPLEGAAGSLENIEKIESFADARRGGTIFVYYKKGTDIKYAYLRLAERINGVRSDIPSEYSVNVVRIDTEQMTNRFMTVQVRGTGGVDRLRNITENDIVRELESIDGVASVEVSGGREKSVTVTLDDQLCEAYGITPSRITSLIRQNSSENAFVGNIVEKENLRAVKVQSRYGDIDDLRDIVISPEGPILLGDIAEIYFGKVEQTNISRVNGKSAVTIQMVKDSEVNLIELSHQTRSVIRRLNGELRSSGIEMVVQEDSASSMEDNINKIIKLAITGGFLAVLILWFFLRNMRLVLIVAAAVPVSIFTALNLFYAFGISINSLTLVGIALAVGLLVDNSIVVLENIYRLRGKGLGVTESVTGGVKEVWRSVFAGTMTTVTVFLPFLFSDEFLIGVIGKHIGVSVISTLLISLAVALVLIPMGAHLILSRSSRRGSAIFSIVSRKNRLIMKYNSLLKTALRFPARVIIMAVIVFFISLFAALALSIGAGEETEARSFNIYVTMPSGSTLESSDAAVRELEGRITGLEEMETLISEIGEEEALLTVRLKKDYYDIKGRDIQSIKDAVKTITRDFDLADISLEQPQSSRRFRGGGGMENAMMRMFGIGRAEEKVVIRGSDFNRMLGMARDIEAYLEDFTSVDRVSMNIAQDNPEVHLTFDQQLLAYHRITPRMIMSELQSFPNEFSSGTTFTAGNEQYDVIVKREGAESGRERTVDDLKNMIIESDSTFYRADQISNIIYGYGKPSIHRINQEKQIEVSYSFISEVSDSRELLESSRQQVDNLIADLNIPSGIAVEVIHEDNDFSEFLFLFGASFILIYMILASVFESLSIPLVIMFTIPLAATGALLLLIFSGTPLLNAYTLTGFLILLGVVVNNGIILIDYSRLLQRRGYRYLRALMTAGQARIRPILITTITTVVAMIPLAMGKSEQTTLVGAPFAITIIGGLSLSSLFTLIFIPVVFSGLTRSLSWIRSRPLWLKALQGALLMISVTYIYLRVESLIWRFIFLFAALMLIPGGSWFVMNSLRKAKAHLIPEDESILIRIRNLGKIYDRKSRFLREWQKGNSGPDDREAGMASLYHLQWQIPVLAFAVYFNYFYLKSHFWQFVISVPVHLYLIYLSRYLEAVPRARRSAGKLIIYALFWLVPLVNLLFFYLSWESPAPVIFIGLVWYGCLLVYRASRKLHDKDINIARITGRLSGIRRLFYRTVREVPLIGRRKKPFTALSMVSIEIEKGMFGLIGPNGAGKTTLMRIICGILEQSFGKITFNGIDTGRHREELQGLIGYLPQEFGLYENMTAVEFLNYQAILKKINDRSERDRRIDQVLTDVHIRERKDDRIGIFSGGMKQRIGIAQILLHMPRVLVVDEPTAGLDPRERIRFRNLLMELSKERIVIFSTHIIEDISSSCNKVAVLSRGNLRFLGTPSELSERARGKVWQFSVPPGRFNDIRGRYDIIHHMRRGEEIRVRTLQSSKPEEEAVEVNPTLEDAYIWMQRGENNHENS